MKTNLQKKSFILFIIIFAIIIIASIPIGLNKDSNWYITSYADTSDNQSMFYTIYNEALNQLIVVDGGWEENNAYVREVIKGMGNHVNAWIVTHYHADHVGAFLNIWENPDGIKIDAVYDSPIDYEQYIRDAQEWDTAEFYTRYIDITKDDSKINHISRGDTISFGKRGNVIDIAFYNAFDEKIKNISDIHNNASLVFEVFGKEESILFTADCHSLEIYKILNGLYGDELNANYLQSPHHGNSQNYKEMVELARPSYVFLDAPQWLMEGENWAAKDLIDYLESNEITYAGFLTAPNEIVLK